jgi:TetR/AcrR family transcriptional regulator, regulator of autoinduction and epiphytic fitness
MSTAQPAPEDSRRGRILDAALVMFTRFGYRKTSMDEVARAAQISRQGLYLHFTNKEELFRATVQHTLETSLQAVGRVLRDASLPLEPKLVRAFDAWVGRYVGMMGGDAADLHEAATALIGPVFEEHENLFADMVAKTLASSRLAAAYKPAGLTARQLADTLAATARGLKHSPSREAFVRGMTVAVRALCAPLKEARWRCAAGSGEPCRAPAPSSSS